MNVRLREFLGEDLQMIEAWSVRGDAKSFMSRFGPRSLKGQFWSHDLTYWRMIVADERDVGTVWLERQAVGDVMADLGIFLGDPGYRGRGVGREALRLIQEEIGAEWHLATIRLRVRESNVRAIRCYEAAGYRKTGASDKCLPDGQQILAIEMKKSLTEPNRVAGGN
jgi:RimJ/RimL family protein N-acetyltransferase